MTTPSILNDKLEFAGVTEHKMRTLLLTIAWLKTRGDETYFKRVGGNTNVKGAYRINENVFGAIPDDFVEQTRQAFSILKSLLDRLNLSRVSFVKSPSAKKIIVPGTETGEASPESDQLLAYVEYIAFVVYAWFRPEVAKSMVDKAAEEGNTEVTFRSLLDFPGRPSGGEGDRAAVNSLVRNNPQLFVSPKMESKAPAPDGQVKVQDTPWKTVLTVGGVVVGAIGVIFGIRALVK